MPDHTMMNPVSSGYTELPHTPQARFDFSVSVESVVKKYDKQVVLKGLSLQIRCGEWLTLLGPSSCGKSTLLKLIAGLSEVNEGRISFNEALFDDESSHQRPVGIVSQSQYLQSDMTVEGYIRQELLKGNLTDEEQATRVREAIALTQLQGLEQRKARELSGTQQSLLALARAMVIQPKMLLLDDPFSSLDKQHRRLMYQQIEQFRNLHGLTVVLVTQDHDQALTLSDRIAVISGGTVLQLSDPVELYQNPQDPFVAAFVADVNILPAYYHGQSAQYVHLRLGSGTISVPRSRVHGDVASDERLDIYVRPEHIHLEHLGLNSVFSGTVVNHVFHGHYIDLLVDIDIPMAVRQVITVRCTGMDSAQEWPIGAVVGLVLSTFSVNVFPSTKRLISNKCD